VDAAQALALTIAGIVLPVVQEKLAGAKIAGTTAIWLNFAAAVAIAIAAISTSWRNASSCCQAARRPCSAILVARKAWVKPGWCLLGSSKPTFLFQESPYDSIGGQEQIRCLSPRTLSIRPTLGQNLLSLTHFNGNAACSRV